MPHEPLIRLRILVGYLGEKAQYDWWSTEFFAPTSEAFLSPVFGRTPFLARYHGVTEGARRLHDERVGVGARVFHLFRLPAVTEQALHGEMLSEGVEQSLRTIVESPDAAMATIEAMADSAAVAAEGPVQIGGASDLNDSDWIKAAAACYRDAFKGNSQCFPYLKDPS